MLKKYKKVVVAEMNMGQLLMVLRAKFLVPAQGLNKIQGKPFKISEILHRIDVELGHAEAASQVEEIGAREEAGGG
jgi:2-oxoglutarate ferredoxin oxidoreductase subunit alpha